MAVDLVLPFVAVALAELGDKSQLCIFLLSSKARNRLQVFLGSMLAFLLVDGFAIAVGSAAADLLPAFPIKAVSGLVFIAFGILTFREKGVDGRCATRPGNPFLSAFSLIFVTEWGDKTQIASGAFAAAYDPVLVFVGVMSALAALSIAAVFLGRLVSGRVGSRNVSRAAGLAFVLIGVSLLLF